MRGDSHKNLIWIVGSFTQMAKLKKTCILCNVLKHYTLFSHGMSKEGLGMR